MGAAALIRVSKPLAKRLGSHTITLSANHRLGVLGNTKSKQWSQEEAKKKAFIKSLSSAKPLFTHLQNGAIASATGDVMGIKKYPVQLLALSQNNTNKNS